MVTCDVYNQGIRNTTWIISKTAAAAIKKQHRYYVSKDAIYQYERAQLDQLIFSWAKAPALYVTMSQAAVAVEVVGLTM